MKYTINWCETKTTQTGKEYMKASIKDEAGKEDDVSIWPDFPFYSEIKPGAVVEGIITVKGVYKNLTAGNRAIRPANTDRLMEKKAGQIAEAQAVRSAGIREAQQTKEESIKISSTARDATLLTVAELTGKNANNEDYKATWLKWRSWLIDNFDVDFKDLSDPTK